MTISWKRIFAILNKDYKDFTRNMAVSTILVLPIIMGAIFGRQGVGALETHYLLINMVFTMVAAFVQCCLIAEEKEKDTLRGLMLSPASTTEILGGKSLLSFILTAVVMFFTIWLAEYHPANLLIIPAALILSALFYIALGTMLGLFARSVMEASVIIMPVIILFSVGSFIVSLAEQYPILKFAEYLPNIQLLFIAAEVESGAGWFDVLPHFGWIAAWAAAAIAFTIYLYRKRMVD